MPVREGAIGRYPCLIAGDGPPLIVLAGLSPDAGVAPGPMRRLHEQALQPWTSGRRVFYVNRRPGLPVPLSMRALAAEHAAALADAFTHPSTSSACPPVAASRNSSRPIIRPRSVAWC
jgi:hypothetical protein